MNPGPPSIEPSRSLSAFYRELGAMAGFLKENDAVPAASDRGVVCHAGRRRPGLILAWFLASLAGSTRRATAAPRPLGASAAHQGRRKAATECRYRS